MKLAKLCVLLVVLALSPRTDAVNFDTVIQPEPDFGDKAVIILPEEENATVSMQCVALQDDQLRITFWFIQRLGDDTPKSISLNNTRLVRSGFANSNMTIFNIAQDLERAQIWCGPVDDQIHSRFLLGFEGD